MTYILPFELFLLYVCLIYFLLGYNIYDKLPVAVCCSFEFSRISTLWASPRPKVGEDLGKDNNKIK
jgi:hypothetical protein